MWKPLTTEDVMQEMTEREVNAVSAAGGRDAMGGVVSRVIGRVRGAVYAGGTALGDEGLIPESLLLDAVALARWRFLISTPQASALQTRERKEAADSAEERLAKIETGELKVEPATGTTEDGRTDGPSFPAARRKKFGQRAEDGI